jgi:hypothetical protein
MTLSDAPIGIVARTSIGSGNVGPVTMFPALMSFDFSFIASCR